MEQSRFCSIIRGEEWKEEYNTSEPSLEHASLICEAAECNSFLSSYNALARATHGSKLCHSPLVRHTRNHAYTFTCFASLPHGFLSKRETAHRLFCFEITFCRLFASYHSVSSKHENGARYLLGTQNVSPT